MYPNLQNNKTRQLSNVLKWRYQKQSYPSLIEYVQTRCESSVHPRAVYISLVYVHKREGRTLNRVWEILSLTHLTFHEASFKYTLLNYDVLCAYIRFAPMLLHFILLSAEVFQTNQKIVWSNYSNEIENRPNDKEIAGMKQKLFRTRREFLLNGVLKTIEILSN